MTFDDCFKLQDMMEEARRRFDQTDAQIKAAGAALDGRLDGKSRGGAAGGVLLSVLWAAVYAAASVEAVRLFGAPMAMGGFVLVLSLALAGLNAAGYLIQAKCDARIFEARDQLARLSGRLEAERSALDSRMEEWTQCGAVRWERPIQAPPSIIEETRRIDASLRGREMTRGEWIGNLKNWLYYPVCAAWAVMGYFFTRGIGTKTLCDAGLPESVTGGVVLLAAAIACAVSVILAKLAWGETDCAVTNLTLLATACGPLALALLLAAVAVVVFVVRLVIYLVALVIAAVFVVSCVIGATCGG